MEQYYVDRPAIDCTEMERKCPHVYDPILGMPWCASDGTPNVDPRDFVRPGDINAVQCYALPSLITAIESDMSRNPLGKARDMFLVPIPRRTLLRLCAQHVHNGNMLPPLLERYVHGLLYQPISWEEIRELLPPPLPPPPPTADNIRDLAARAAVAKLAGWTRRDWQTRNNDEPQAQDLMDIDILPIVRSSAARMEREHPVPEPGNITPNDLRALFLNMIWQHYNIPERANRIVALNISDRELRLRREAAERPPTRRERRGK